MTSALTVIVPGFDVGPWVGEALASLQSQTFRQWRAVLVDDASTDDTLAIFTRAAAEDERFSVIRHPERRGLAAARNTGLDAVDTPYLAFLDGDDRFTPTALERLVTVLDDTGSDFVVGAYVRLRADETGAYAAGPVQPWVAAATDPERRRTSLEEHPAASGNIVAWSKVSRHDFWQRTGLRFPEGRLYEDQILAQRMYGAARSFDVIPDVVVEWRERADGSSITQHTEALPVLRDYLDGLRGGLEILDAAGLPAAVRARIELILTLDLPPLITVARSHHDDAYRRALGAFVRDLQGRGLDRAVTPEMSAAALW
ncbi:glycosyltransferase involved in cell wall biosynthesis [Microbacterium sp. AK009]|uniref:glycosyltransferase family 2 protein n=1 Tax=Microbacterium sp. AK009 TaxID=2723068 RepID=UPI0015CEE203|nr:glycosyltransferase family 2 protein [Microbacterium sp. AK009]NYF17349.1 glycosyltransferase involved in cell wall biosynthesis [Microbacterium sp. AK009]